MRYLILGITFLFLAGCAANSNLVSGPRTTITGPKVQPIQRLAVLPLTGTKASAIMSQDYLPKLVTALQMVNPDIDIISLPPPSADSKATTKTIQFGTATQQQTLPTAPNIDAVLSGEILTVHQQNGEFGIYPGNTRVTILYQLRDIKNNALLWEKTINGSRETMTTLQPAPSIAAALEDATQKLTKTMPALKTQKIVKLPPREKVVDDMPLPLASPAPMAAHKNHKKIPLYLQRQDYPTVRFPTENPRSQ